MKKALSQAEQYLRLLGVSEENAEVLARDLTQNNEHGRALTDFLNKLYFKALADVSKGIDDPQNLSNLASQARYCKQVAVSLGVKLSLDTGTKEV